MAKKRKKKSTRRRVRRLSGAGEFDFMSPLLALGGGIGTKLLDKIIPDTWEGKTTAMVKVAAGVALPMLAKDAKQKQMLQNVGNGMVAVAGTQLLAEMGILSDDVMDDDEMEFAVEVPEKKRGRKNSMLEADVLADDGEFEEINADVLADDDDDLSVINDSDDDLSVINDDYLIDDED